ncbi:inactive tetrahydroanabasine acetyltransferase pauper allele [Aegilops tauschii subsp. strangulata]|uniref:3'-N-debenzoyl-2'-deoxytaxol N-benzoyltransferase n=2 Tax=Aegilops tauschii TaxID=37682 RepID=A0A453MMS4_AEGTS|nr:spermidine sinapoyl-CoA acyltransferase [Aegilops tauschii subsp. strangulata]
MEPIEGVDRLILIQGRAPAYSLASNQLHKAAARNIDLWSMESEPRVVDTIQLVPVPAPVVPMSAPLSVLDSDHNVFDVDFRTLRIFPSHPPSIDPFIVLQRAFAAALGVFPEMAGSVHDDGRVLVSGSGSDAVPLVLAVSDLRADQVDADRLDAALLELLVPSDRVAAAEPALALKATVFACGGVALGMRCAHALCDGAGAGKFLAAAALLAQGQELGVTPVWERQERLGSRRPPRWAVPFERVLAPHKDKDVGPYSRHGQPVARECFHVSDASVEALRKQLSAEAGLKLTTFEVIAAFIWRARVKANGTGPDEVVKMVYSMNMSRILEPALPDGYWGNACVPVYVALAAGELVGQGLADTAALIRRSKQAVDDEYVRSYIDFQEMHRRRGERVTAGGGVSAFTDWRRLGHSEVDFGWGRPDVVLPLSWRIIGSTFPCFLLPYSSTDERRRRGFKVLVALMDHALPCFTHEMQDILLLHSPTPMPKL